MHPKYDCRACKYLFCIYAKLYKHIHPSHCKPDVQSLKLCYRCSNWVFSQFIIPGYHKLYGCNFFGVSFWILFLWKPSEIFMILELFLGQILWRTRNKWEFLTFHPKCHISGKILKVSKWQGRFLIAILPNILRKEKNEIGLTTYSLNTEICSTQKWYNNAKPVKSHFKWS